MFSKQVDKMFEDNLVFAENNQRCKRKSVGVAICSYNVHGNVICWSRTANGPAHIGHECSNEVGNCGCCHAEPRVIMNVMRLGPPQHELPPLFMVSTYSPCTNCANIIIDSKHG